MQFKKIHYWWFILVACMFMQAIPFNISMNLQPQFMQYVIEGKWFSVEQFSLIFMFSSIAWALASPFVWKLFTKFKTKLLFIIWSIITGLWFMSFAFADKITNFYFISSVTQVWITIIWSIWVPVIMNKWFWVKIKWKVLWYVFAWWALWNIILQQLAALDLAKFWSEASYFILWWIALWVSLIISLFIIKDPKDETDVIKTLWKSETEDSDKTNNEVEYTLFELKNMPYFWLLSIGFVFLGLYISTLMIQFPHYLGISGLSLKLVGTVLSVISVFSLMWNLIWWKLFDRIWISRSMLIAWISCFIWMICLFLTKFNIYIAFIFAGFTWFAIFSYIMWIAYMTGSLFWNKEYWIILWFLNISFAIWHVTGSAFSGYFVEKIGYSYVWWILVFIVAISYILIYMAISWIEKINSKKMLLLRK